MAVLQQPNEERKITVSNLYTSPKFPSDTSLSKLLKFNHLSNPRKTILGTETSSKYEIKNHLGQRVYFAVEENDCFDRNLCSPIRSFTIRIADNVGREVITVNRPLRCNSCWFPCFLQEVKVQSPPGTIAGYVVQNWDPFLPKFTIQNESKEDVLKIIGPYVYSCFLFVQVKALNEMSTIGKISKYWSGFVNNVFTNTANFGIQVPVDLDVRIKAVMIGACFLIVKILLLLGEKCSSQRFLDCVLQNSFCSVAE
uniref:Phospholipid scramblase n=1 Tax=Buteo japonicus TaxID=224669 RepID=A0A8C0ASC4_9AVES